MVHPLLTPQSNQKLIISSAKSTNIDKSSIPIQFYKQHKKNLCRKVRFAIIEAKTLK